jgi:hypothetical protein
MAEKYDARIELNSPSIQSSANRIGAKPANSKILVDAIRHLK